MKNLDKDQRNYIIAGFFCICLLIFIYSFSATYSTSSQAIKENEISLMKLNSIQKDLSDLYRSMGYVGVIHNFKNYVLRRDKTYYYAAKESLSKSYQSLQEIKSHLNEEASLSDNLEIIRTTLENYEENLQKVDIEIKDITLVDRFVKVNDVPAATALDWLSVKIEKEITETENRIKELNRESIETLKFSFKLSLILFGCLFLISLYLLSRLQQKEKATLKELLEEKILSQHNSRMASIGFLAAGVCHEINNPLAILYGFVESLKSKIATGTLNQQNLDSSLDRMQYSLSRIHKVTDGLRHLSRNNKNEKSFFNPRCSINKVLALVEELYKKEKIQLDVRIQEILDNCQIYGNESNYIQIFMNLLGNAKDALQGQTNAVIRIYGKENDGFCEFFVEDNGPGIDISNREKIYDPFFTTKDPNKGTGLGLALVFRYVESLSGEIYLDEKYQCGARFVFRVPITYLDEQVDLSI
ncbi:MAG: HAMP domain-containing sensor histidine kinase [Bdellovibrionota bacterium]|nr:HAMP domain-containing sensor histidine kinase [Bdellovibrionota bacterium]